MNSPAYYTRQQEPWSLNEIETLKNEYQENHSIMDLGIKHLRTPGTISHQLKKMGFIKSMQEARGYPEYKISELYQNIVKESQEKEREKKEQKKEREKKEQKTQCLVKF